MTSKELKRMSRGELLQMLLSQVEENERLQKQLEDIRTQLKDRRIVCENAGSIAEAALKINGVFEAAQQAAQQYLDNVQLLKDEQDQLCRKLEEEAREKADRILIDADEYKTNTVKEADEYRVNTVKEADEYKANMVREADEYKANTIKEADAYKEKVTTEADAYWSRVQDTVDNLLKEHQNLTTLLQSAGRK